MCNVSEKSPGSLAAVAEALRRSERLVVTTHVRMDADAVGSAAALCRAAGAAGKQCCLVLLDTVPRRCRYLLEDCSVAGAEELPRLAEAADCVVVLDTCSFAQLAPVAEELTKIREKVVVIDHHATADDVGAVVWRDVSASAVGLMLVELFEQLGWPVQGPTAEALATAILSDTGWLRHANTDERTVRAVADLLAAGVEPNAVYAKIYQSDRPERLRLLAAALGSLRLHAADRLAVMTLTAEDFATTGAGEDETEDFVNEPLRIASVEISAIVVAGGGGTTRVSLRSRRLVDVAALAKTFGGGGHARAAGCTVAGDLSDVTERLVEACTKALAGVEGA